MIKKAHRHSTVHVHVSPQTDKSIYLKDYINLNIDRKPLTEKPIKRP